ncbi:MAG: PTS sugar transporter subunit IIB [Defluviitaleaceae bacterium]|nr:PTS sugar transporter subunit IIB [Defluviitaleaceae bacterium]
MIQIKHIRIDDRLIHGQIITAWISDAQCDTIIVADDKSAADSLSQTLFRMAVPNNISLEIATQQQAAELIKDEEKTGSALLIVRGVRELRELLEHGVSVTSVNVGNISQHPTRKKFSKSIWLDESEITLLQELGSRGIEMEVRVVPGDKKVNILEMIKA